MCLFLVPIDDPFRRCYHIRAVSPVWCGWVLRNERSPPGFIAPGGAFYSWASARYHFFCPVYRTVIFLSYLRTDVLQLLLLQKAVYQFGFSDILGPEIIVILLEAVLFFISLSWQKVDVKPCSRKTEKVKRKKLLRRLKSILMRRSDRIFLQVLKLFTKDLQQSMRWCFHRSSLS